MQTRIVAFGFALAMAGAVPAAAQEWASSYTRHDYAKCRKAGPDEGDVSVRRCPGKAGIAVTWTAGDDSSLVEFGPSPTQESLPGNAAFFEAGSTIEWRGPKGGKPQAAILRYATGQSIGKLDGSRLVVYRLGADGASCIIGSIDGRSSEANVQARRLADEKAAGFRCGQSRRSDR
jgi:hypothetical protein